jgi:hypothetical protein
MPCSRIQRRRARANSARSCSAARRLFFEADAVAIEEPPYRGPAARDLSLAHRRNDLVQRQVRLLSNETQQPFRMLFERRGTAAAWLCSKATGVFPALRPKNHHAGAEFISFGRLATRRTGLDRFDHACTQVVGIWLRHRLPPENRINAARLAIDKPLWILPIQPERKMLWLQSACSCDLQHPVAHAQRVLQPKHLANLPHRYFCPWHPIHPRSWLSLVEGGLITDSDADRERTSALHRTARNRRNAARAASESVPAMGRITQEHGGMP